MSHFISKVDVRNGFSINVVIGISLGILLFLPFVLEPAPIALAQSPVTAGVDRTLVTADEQVTLNVSVTGDFLNIPNPDLSQIQDFVVVSSSTSTQVSIINGKMSSQKIFIYRLQPLREGRLVISPLSLNIGGQIYQTDPIEIEVVASGTQITPPGVNTPEPNSPDTPTAQRFFVEAEVSNPTPHLGEQIVYIFRLFQAVQFPPGQPDYRPPAFTDFWSDEILDQPHYNTEVDGRRYLVTEIQTALFPANLGSITIEPASLVIPGGFLNPDIKLESNPVSVEVLPLPENAPADFSGAVGQFEIRASLSESEVLINEPVTLLVEIAGTGNIQTLTEPALPELSDWRFFESQSATAVDSSDGILRGTRTFERLIVPGRSGEKIFPPLRFSYFDPKDGAYKTVSSEPLPISVRSDGSTPAPVNIVGGGDERNPTIERIAVDIRHIKSVPDSLNTSQERSSVAWFVYWSSWILPALLVGAVQIWQSRQRRFRLDTAFARDQRAHGIALKILAEAQQSGSDRPATAAGRALLGYLSDKLNSPVAGLTTAKLVEQLHQSRIDPNLVDRVESLLHQIDVGRFAPITESAAQSVVTEAQHLINDLERSLGKRR